MIEIYADGAQDSISEQGGWVAVIVEDNQKQVLSGATPKTTSNRMEITAALEGILGTPESAEVVVHTDSKYVIGCASKGWRRKANRDLWEKLDVAAKERKVRWQWIGSNDRNPYHQEAHNLAESLAASGEKLQPTPPESQKPETEAPVMEKLTHIDASGRPRMVDVSDKPETYREAVAKGMVRMQPSTFDLIKKGKIEKGDVLTVAQLAGIMAAKQTPHLIPLCHPIPIDEVKVEFDLSEGKSTIEITATVRSTGKTGAEMEALTATAVAALTIYDMCKAVERGMKIENIRLVSKSGGKSGAITLE